MVQVANFVYVFVVKIFLFRLDLVYGPETVDKKLISCQRTFNCILYSVLLPSLNLLDNQHNLELLIIFQKAEMANRWCLGHILRRRVVLSFNWALPIRH